MKKEFETFVRHIEDIEDIQQEGIPLIIRELTPGRRKYGAIHVMARVSWDPNKFPDWDILWVRSTVGNKHPSPCALNIVSVLPDLIPGLPFEDAYAALKRWQG